MGQLGAQRAALMGALTIGLAGAAVLGATPAAAFPVLPEARAFLDPDAGYGVCGPASGGFATSCAPSGIAYGGTETAFVYTGPSTASYTLGANPEINITSNFEQAQNGDESGATSATLIYEVELCADPTCSGPGTVVHPIPLRYSIDYSYTPSPLPDAGPPTYNANLSFDYYGGTPLQQATLCDFCNNPQTLGFGINTVTLNMQAGIVYELALNVQFEGVGLESLTFDPTFTAPPGSGTLIYSPLVTGGVPEPATWALLLAGFGAIGAAARRRRALTS